MLNDTILEFIGAVDSVESEEGLINLIERTSTKLGVKYFATGEVSGFLSRPPMAAGNYPEEMVKAMENVG